MKRFLFEGQNTVFAQIAVEAETVEEAIAIVESDTGFKLVYEDSWKQGHFEWDGEGPEVEDDTV